MRGNGLYSFSFNAASSKARDRFTPCALCHFLESPARGGLWPPSKGNRATGGTTKSEASLQSEWCGPLQTSSPASCLIADGHTQAGEGGETCPGAVPKLAFSCASQLPCLPVPSHLEACQVCSPALCRGPGFLPCPFHVQGSRLPSAALLLNGTAKQWLFCRLLIMTGAGKTFVPWSPGR